MNLNPEHEWKIIKQELFDNRPVSEPFSPSIIKRRELLLIAQCFLSNYENEKVQETKAFFSKLYKITMDTYAHWESSAQIS